MKINFKKSLLMLAVASSVGLAGFAGSGVVSAATNPTAKTDSGNGLAGKIATKFHLNKSDVKSVIDQDKKDHQAKRQAAENARLNQAVADGKITAAQKALIISKRAELKADKQANRASMKTKSKADRQAFRAAQLADLQKWASDNGIPLDLIHAGGAGKSSTASN